MNSKEDFKIFKKETFGLFKATYPIVDTLGDNPEIQTIIGYISMNFIALENNISKAIIAMLQLDRERGLIVTSELSFRNLVNLFSSLYHNLKNNYSFNLYSGFEDDHFSELIKIINKCETDRNRALHSSFVQVHDKRHTVYRKKISSKQRIGLNIINEKTTFSELMNTADTIIYTSEMIREFSIDIMTEKKDNNTTNSIS